MRYSRHLVSLRTFGLAFAVVLTPALMQVEVPSCEGDTTLAVLEFKPLGMDVHPIPDLIADFDPQQRVYAVDIPAELIEGQPTQVMVVAEATDATADLAIQCYVGDEFIAGHPMDPAYSWTMIDLPSGDSTVMVFVRPAGGDEGKYAIHVNRL